MFSIYPINFLEERGREKLLRGYLLGGTGEDFGERSHVKEYCCNDFSRPVTKVSGFGSVGAK
jgi:hypothetical protein